MISERFIVDLVIIGSHEFGLWCKIKRIETVYPACFCQYGFQLFIDYFFIEKI